MLKELKERKEPRVKQDQKEVRVTLATLVPLETTEKTERMGNKVKKESPEHSRGNLVRLGSETQEIKETRAIKEREVMLEK